MLHFKGRGEHSVNDLEKIILEQLEEVYQKQLKIQDQNVILLEALRLLQPDKLKNMNTLKGRCKWYEHQTKVLNSLINLNLED